MNDADLDRTLRAWLEPGIDRAPERFVWRALDDVEHVRQRPAWVSALDGALRPVAPIGRMIAVAAVLLVALGLFLAYGRPNVGDDSVGPPDVTTDDLVRIVVWDDTAPPGWTLDSLVTTPAEVLHLPVRSMDGATWRAQGVFDEFVGGRYTDFSTDDAALISWAVVFRTADAAADAFDLYRDDLTSPDGWGLGTEERVALGQEGALLSGDTTALMGAGGEESVPMQIYLWRSGNVLMAAGGWFEFDPAELRAVARGMDSRAQQPVSP
jgi:hypothetical protein